MDTPMEKMKRGKCGRKGSLAVRLSNMRYKAQQRGELPPTEMFGLDKAIEMAGL